MPRDTRQFYPSLSTINLDPIRRVHPSIRYIFHYNAADALIENVVLVNPDIKNQRFPGYADRNNTAEIFLPFFRFLINESFFKSNREANFAGKALPPDAGSVHDSIQRKRGSEQFIVSLKIST